MHPQPCYCTYCALEYKKLKDTMERRKHNVVITEDGWVYVEFSDGTEKGLGDLNVDVDIYHEGVGKSLPELIKMIPHEKEVPYCWCNPRQEKVGEDLYTIHRCSYCQMTHCCCNN